MDIKNAVMKSTTTGHIVNLLLAYFMHFLVLGPVLSVAILGILWSELGAVAL
jgi:hypothetical protein